MKVLLTSSFQIKRLQLGSYEQFGASRTMLEKEGVAVYEFNEFQAIKQFVSSFAINKTLGIGVKHLCWGGGDSGEVRGYRGSSGQEGFSSCRFIWLLHIYVYHG